MVHNWQKKKKIVASKEATILFPADSLEKDLSKPVYIWNFLL